MYIQSLRSENQVNSFTNLFAFNGKVNEVIAISAYTDPESIDELIDFAGTKSYAGQKPSLRFFIDSSSSHFFSSCVKDGLSMKDVFVEKNKEILSFCDSESGIYLVQFGTLFHSKAYLIKGNNTGKVFFGSLNLTRRGITSNEELVVADEFNVSGNSYGSRLAAWVHEYADALHGKSMRVDVALSSRRRSTSCMRQMLLDGVIWYELKEQNPFRFSLCLPKDVVFQQANIDPLLDANVTDSISLERLISTATPHGIGLKLPKLTDKIHWKKFCIETCYGHWNPECLQAELDEELNKRMVSREPYYKKILDCIRGNRKQLLDCFLQLRERIQNYLDKQDITEWKYASAEKAEADWNIWLDRVLTKVENKDYYRRLVLGIYSVPTPDVWSDPLSAREFEESFCDSILYLWSKEITKLTSNVVAQNVALNLDLVDDGKEYLDVKKLYGRIDFWLQNNSRSIACWEE